MSIERSANIIEIAGLPGAGKTTSGQIISKYPGYQELSFSQVYFQRIRRFHLDKIFFPVTAFKFRRVFKEFYLAENNNGIKTYSFWIVLLTFRAILTKGAKKTLYPISPTLDIFFVINVIVIMYLLARMEALFRKKCLIMCGEGFIERGLSVWVRTPNKLRNRIMDAYYSSLPQGISCIVIECEPKMALSRVEKRPKNLKTILRLLRDLNVDPKWLSQQFEEMPRLFNESVLPTHISFAQVASQTNREDQANAVLDKINAMRDKKEIVWWIF